MNYTGIGSRDIPEWVGNVIEQMGTWLAKKGNTLRSGGAEGADSAFERGCDKVGGAKEIYLPWKNFNGNNSPLYEYDNGDKAFEIAQKYHPYWDNLSNGGKVLQARNSYQVLGADLKTPSDFIVCYTESGKEKGGTSQAMRIAKDNGIPIFNLGNYTQLQQRKLVEDFNAFYSELKDKIEQIEKEDFIEK